MKTVILLNSAQLGRGDGDLGERLMGSFLRKLWVSEGKPECILFYNSAVRLLADGSPVLDALNGLADVGVDLVACGTCVGHYKLSEKLALGRISDMQEIVELIMRAERIINP